MHAVLVLCTSLVLLFACATSAIAPSASLVARVTDPGRAVVPGAPVVLTHAQSNTQYAGLTGNDGTARFTGLAPGEYRLEIAARYFRSTIRPSSAAR
jgi:Carboxypeptidase regulatory-like domain